MISFFDSNQAPKMPIIPAMIIIAPANMRIYVDNWYKFDFNRSAYSCLYINVQTPNSVNKIPESFN